MNEPKWYCSMIDGVPPRPRCQRQCQSCAKLRPDERQLARDPDFERRYFEDICVEVQRRFNVDVHFYADRVLERLQTGADRYGDGDFLTKDVIKELLEETPDVGGYSALETQKQMRDPYGDTDVIFWLREAAVFGAMADHAALQAARRVRAASR